MATGNSVRLTLSLLLLAAAANAQNQNLLPNPSLEDGPPRAATGWRGDFWEPTGQPRSTADVSDTEAHTGKRSLHMAGTGAGSHAYWSCRNLPAEAGKRYVLSVWVKPHGVMPPASLCRVHLGFQDAKGEIIQDKDHPYYSGWAYASLDGYGDWMPLALETRAPAGAARMYVTFRFVGIGEAWFDDARLVADETAAVPTPPEGLSQGATCQTPATVAGETYCTLTIRNQHSLPAEGLKITASGPVGLAGQSAEPLTLAPGKTSTVPISVGFPPNLTSRDARVLFTGTYTVGKVAKTAQWLGTFSVVPAALMEAVKTNRWGVTDGAAPAGSPPMETLGLLLTRKGVPQYLSSTETVELRPEDDALAVIVRVNGRAQAEEGQVLRWECLDYFFRSATGQLPVEGLRGRSYLAKVEFPATHVRRLYQAGREAGADRFRLLCRLERAGKEVASDQTDFRLQLAPPAAPRLAALPAGTTEELPVYGRLRLVDVVLCSDENDPHALRQGGRGLHNKYTSDPLDYYGGKDRLNFDWARDYRDDRDQFTRIETILGRPCRVTDNWGWFAYRVGRGLLQPGRRYVLAVDYPEDTSRSFLIWNGLDGSASVGFHTGTALGDPHTRQRFMQKVDLPLSGQYRRHYTLFTPTATEGWIAIHSVGPRADPFSAGIAVNALRLYELGDEAALDSLALRVSEPEGLPRRQLGFIQEDATPSAARLAQYQLLGLNMYAPLILSYGGGTYATNSGYVGWPSKLFGPDGLRNENALAKPPYYRLQPLLADNVLAEADKRGMTVVPLLEYCGTGQLPPEALAVWPDGKPHYYHWGTTTGADGLRTMRYLEDGQCLDMAHPAVGEDLAKMVTELATQLGRHPSFGGLALAPRFSAWQISYSDYELQRFARDRNLTLPSQGAGQWVRDHHLQDFYAWHYERKRENLLRATEALRKVNPNLRLMVLNYNGGDDNLHFGTPLYWWDRQKADDLLVPGQVSLPDVSRLNLAQMMEDPTRPDVAGLSVGMNPPLYTKDKGLLNLPPAHYPFLCGNADFLNHFRTAEGSAVCLWWIYNEDAFMNHSALGWNCPGLNGNEPAGRHSMLDEVLAMAASDPVVLAVRMGQLNRGFPQYAREFAAAYRALPAVPSTIIKACADPQIVVRQYETARGTYLAVINTGLGPQSKTVQLRLPAMRAGKVRNLATGEQMLCDKDTIMLKLEPVSLTALYVLP
ncbi:MAG: hypothetical protein ACYC63_15025 [Armatimonadota bacterium]